ncbi:hypothetical protein AHF37_03153 [Paragonimus kellicotti]|nr:hypothetical protein AHF37_03153 [Paragonimus kellicotti]
MQTTHYISTSLIWIVLFSACSFDYFCEADCSKAIHKFVPSQIRETGGYRLHCFEPKTPDGNVECYVHFVRKMSFEDGIKACKSLGARIITIRDAEHSRKISNWVEYSFYINAKRIEPKSAYFYYYIYPPKYTNIACDTSILGRDCMIVRTTGLWCTAQCEEKHSIVCEF